MTIRGCSYSLIMWLVLAVLAVINGTIREFGIKKFIGDPWANRISVLTGITIFFVASYVFMTIFKSYYSSKDTVLVGIGWVVLTVAFEFLFGHYATGHSWDELLQQYNVLAGNLWPFALLAIGLSPWVAFKLIK